jgi:hypothetical protein
MNLTHVPVLVVPYRLEYARVPEQMSAWTVNSYKCHCRSLQPWGSPNG